MDRAKDECTSLADPILILDVNLHSCWRILFTPVLSPTDTSWRLLMTRKHPACQSRRFCMAGDARPLGNLQRTVLQRCLGTVAVPKRKRGRMPPRAPSAAGGYLHHLHQVVHSYCFHKASASRRALHGFHSQQEDPPARAPRSPTHVQTRGGEGGRELPLLPMVEEGNKGISSDRPKRRRMRRGVHGYLSSILKSKIQASCPRDSAGEGGRKSSCLWLRMIISAFQQLA